MVLHAESRAGAVAQLPHGTGSERFRISAVAGQLRY
jgi:hypothetical protein